MDDTSAAQAGAVGPFRSHAVEPRLLGAAAAGLTAAAYAPGLNRSLGYDAAESVGFFILADSPAQALTTQRHYNNHPFFSFLESILVQVTGRSDEWVLRLLPIAFGAAAVGLLVWYVAGRSGAIAATAAGTVLATNPMFIEHSRDVRGYSLMVLCALAATIAYLEHIRTPTPRLLRVYASFALTGLLTHLFIAPVLLAHAVDALRRRTLGGPWLRTWSFIGVSTAVFYSRTVDEMLDGGSDRGRIFRPEFPWDLAREVLGHQPFAVAILGVLAIHGLFRLRHDRIARTFVSVTAVVMVVFWLLGPENLAPRFFLWAVPAVAVLAAVSARSYGRAGVLAIGLAAVASVTSVAGSYTESPNRYPDVAEVIEQRAAAGDRVCVTNLSVPPMLAYTRSFEALTDPADARRCDVVAIAEPGLDEEYVDTLGPRFAHRTNLDARDPAVIFSREPIDPPA